MNSSKSYVVKRDGKRQPFYFDKITKRNEELCKDLNIDVPELTQSVVSNMKSGMKTEEIDILSSETAIYMSVKNDEYEVFAKRVCINNLHKKTCSDFVTVTKEFESIVQEEYFDFVIANGKELNEMIDYSRDYLFNYFGIKTLEKGYLWKKDEIVERPQHMWMRVATFLCFPDLKRIKESYDAYSTLKLTQASPTLFNAGSKYPQLSSCFLLCMDADSISGIYSTLSKVAMISKYAGGIGVSIQNIRASGSTIKSTMGTSNGIIPMLKVFNECARHVDQSSKRKGSFAFYLEPWHPDVFDFLKMRVTSTHDNMRCLDLHNALWVPDLLMKRVKNNEKWSLFCPNDVPKLYDTFGEEFEKIYSEAEEKGLAKKVVDAQDLFKAILSAQIETGEPYIHFKDAVNRKTNQKNLGTIRSSNLCVTGDTFILTKNGYKEIQSLKNETVQVWNGFEYSQVIVQQTSESAKIIRVYLSNGDYLDCTPYHKFYLSGSLKDEKEKMIQAEYLRYGMKLVKFNLPEYKHEPFKRILPWHARGFVRNALSKRNLFRLKDKFPNSMIQFLWMSQRTFNFHGCQALCVLMLQ